MDFIYVAVFSELQTCLQDQNQVKSGTDLESCWVNLLTFFFFSKKIRHFMSRTSFLALTKKIWKRCIQTDLSLVSCLEQLSGKISLGWKNLVGFKMWLQCSRGTLCDMVAGVALQGTSGVIWFCFKFAGIWGGKKEVGKTGSSLLKAKGRDNWCSYSVQKALKSIYWRSQGCDRGWPINCATAMAVIKTLKSMTWGRCMETWGL